jgi:hypothetical protein
MADVLRHSYDDAISSMGHRKGGADGVLICGGMLRGDSRYGPGDASRAICARDFIWIKDTFHKQGQLVLGIFSIFYLSRTP